MLDVIKNPKKYSKFYAGLLGAVLTWAVATFPANHNVQLWGSLLLSLLTGATVYSVTNQGK